MAPHGLIPDEPHAEHTATYGTTNIPASVLAAPPPPSAAPQSNTTVQDTTADDDPANTTTHTTAYDTFTCDAVREPHLLFIEDSETGLCTTVLLEPSEPPLLRVAAVEHAASPRRPDQPIDDLADLHRLRPGDDIYVKQKLG